MFRGPFAGALMMLTLLLGLAAEAHAQYFGRNKVQYRTFLFQVLRTEHFDIYYYPEETEAADMVARLAERWRARLGRFFQHDLRGRQAVILYAAPAHFRQTNAVDGILGEGTGGVTEALRRRIVLPMAGSLADTDHVLGHELVHAYQFDMTGTSERMTDGSFPEILTFPLWFVEGMAEYLSLGPVDAQTAMWMRDGVLSEKLPRVQDLDKPEYFPYRWGHAFWAYVGGRFGDRWVASLLRSSANPRSDIKGFAFQLGTTPDALNADWHKAMRDATAAIERDRPSLASGARRVIAEDLGAGRLNVGPRISPDGRLMAFFSEKDLFSVELYVADAVTGKIQRKLVRSASDPHFDSLQFLNSAGAWSPEGRSFALTAVRSGRPVIVLVDVVLGRITREIPLPGLDDALSPVWSPDAQTIVFSGSRGGFVDLYRLDMSGRGEPAPQPLMSDAFADLEPAFTPDGRSLVFVTDRFSSDLAGLVSGPLRLARLDLASGAVRAIAGFLKGKHLSPHVSPDGRMVTFIGEPDGIANVYRMAIDGGPIDQLTSVGTGVAGITSSSPALSMAASTGRLAFSVFEKGGAAIFTLDEADAVSLVAPATSTRGSLLPLRTAADGPVQQVLSDFRRGLPAASSSASQKRESYSSKLELDAVGQPSVTAGVSSWGTYVGGSVSALFKDVLGDRLLSTGAEIGGSLSDFGGWLSFVNRRSRWNWGFSIDQSPYRAELVTGTRDVEHNEFVADNMILRQISRGAAVLAQYPFSQSARLEVTTAARQMTFSRENRISTYDLSSGTFLRKAETKESIGDPINIAEFAAAIVHDSSYFGATSPIYGRRYRLEAGGSRGTLNYHTILVDARQYVMPVRPVTVGVRALHFGRYGANAEHELLVPLFIGYPELVRGYGFGSFSANECRPEGGESGPCGALDRLVGSRMAVANVEVRAPLPGLFRGELDYGRFPVELVGFFDAGIAWTRDSRPSFAGGTREFARSAGAAVRFNVFGFFALEVSAARPFDRLDRSIRWQLGLRQGF
jgi:Tol biopolymer transport system component